jgi:beta-fructofuranosidase
LRCAFRFNRRSQKSKGCAAKLLHSLCRSKNQCAVVSSIDRGAFHFSKTYGDTMQNRVRKQRVSRRSFLQTAAGLAASLSMQRPLHALNAFEPIGTAAPVPEATLAADPMRPQFHLLPARNWMNDPNGPICFQGNYHMFFQYNPLAAVWGDMSWNHAISPDMIHWKHLPVAMTPTAGGPDAFGCFSGSCLADGERVYAVYTGVVESTPDKATIRDGSNKLEESQCLAYSDDPKLRTWTKLPKPIVAQPPPGLAITGFRDPSAWKQDGMYYMTVGSGIARQGGAVLLYRSRDLGSDQPWEYLHMLVDGKWSGVPAANPVDSGEMWECPEFFALDGGHVLIYSTEGKVFWNSGHLDRATMQFTPKHRGELDLGAFYAPKTQLDAEGRRILWGWIPEKRPEQAMREAGWSGMMSLPRVLHLDANGILRMQMLPALSGLRGAPLSVQTGGQIGTRAGVQAGVRPKRFVLLRANGELLCKASRQQPLEFVLSESVTHNALMRVRYEPTTHAVMVDEATYVLEPDDLPAIHAYVDGSVISVIISERIGYTKRFYYQHPTAPDIEAVVSGAGVEAHAWSVDPISSNRLTTPVAQV